MINLTTMGINATNTIAPQFTPSDACFDWCTVQHVVNAHNANVYSLIFIVLAWVFLTSIPFLREHEEFKKYDSIAEYGARIMLILFIGYYFLVVIWGIV